MRFDCDSEEWNEHFLRGLDENNLRLVACNVAEWDGSRYPTLVPLQAPLPSTAGGPTWTPSYMVWKDDQFAPKAIWSAALMPDEALAPDSLVGRMLNPGEQSPTAGSTG